MRKMLSLLVILLVVGLSYVVYGASPESYMPLKEGMVWEFQYKVIDLKTKNQVDEAKSTKKILPPVDIKGTKVTPQLFSFYKPKNVLQNESKYFIRKEPSGFSVFARQSKKDKVPKIIDKKFYVLKFPLTKGASWKHDLKNFTVNIIIESSNADVQVPAGTFKNCLLIKKLYFNKGDVKKPTQESLFWFAPGVGNVKVVRKNFEKNREVTQELVSFKK